MVPTLGAAGCRCRGRDAEILLKLARKLRDFVYDPASSFRGWLKTVAHHAWRDFIDGQSRARTVADDHIRELLQSVEAREDLIQKLEEAFDLRVAGSGQGAGATSRGAAHLGGIPTRGD